MEPARDQIAKQRARALRAGGTRMKEVLLVSLVIVLAAVVGYTSQETHTAFGILDQPVYAHGVPVVTSFADGSLSGAQVLQLDVPSTGSGAVQAPATLIVPTHPEPVRNVQAINTRVGKEVALFFDRPATVAAVNIYRNEELLVEHWTEEQYIDTELENGVSVVYRVTSVATVDGVDYLADSSGTATAVPSDQIPPFQPTTIMVTSVNDPVEGEGLQITWTMPADDDLDHITLYRSEVYGNRGDAVTTLPADGDSSYRDTSVQPNVTYYYTVVAVDAAGNASSGDFSIPTPGNPSPFTPIAR